MSEDMVRDIRMNFNDLEDVEVKLVDMAQHLSVTGDEEFQKVLGRAMMALAPAWVGFLKGEKERNYEEGPGLCVAALVKNFAFLSFLLFAATAKNKASFKKGVPSVASLFVKCLKDFSEEGIEESFDDENRSKAVH